MTPLLLALLAALQAPAASGRPVEDAPVAAPREPEFAELFFAEVGRIRLPRALVEPEVAGDVTLLAVLSIDSPACEAAAPLLAELDARHREHGLSILVLAFDSTGDFPADAERVAAFAKRHALDVPLFVSGVSDPATATRALGWSEPVRAFPAFRLAGRDRRWTPALQGLREDELRAELERRIVELLAEPRHDAPELWASLLPTDWRIRTSHPRELSGDSPTFFERDGERLARLEGDERDFPVDLRGACMDVFMTLRFDSEAGVWQSPYKLGTRMHPRELGATPLLARRGYDGEAGVARALRDRDPTVRREALFALGEMRRWKGDAREARALLEDPALDVRIAAAWACGEAKDIGAEEALWRLAEHPHPPLRCAVISALVKVGDERTFTRFRDAIETERDPLAQWAVLTEALD